MPPPPPSLPLLSCDLWMVVKENPDRKKKEKKYSFFVSIIWNSNLFYILASQSYLLYVDNEDSCFRNCGTFNNSYLCYEPDGCEDLGNPNKNITIGDLATLSNIPCAFAQSVATSCDLDPGMNQFKKY